MALVWWPLKRAPMSDSMCGIVGVVGAYGRELSVDEADLVRMRDQMLSRGPDDAGVRFSENVAMGARRLAVMDPGSGGSQPMLSSDGRWCVVYNGELYNDAELRERLAEGGYPAPAGRGDTSTILAAIEAWGLDVICELRGMYALGIHDRQRRSVHLARDPQGIKPLYWAFDGTELTFASDPRAILAHPKLSVGPDLEGISAYLTSVRSCVGGRTMFEGVHSLGPGEIMELKTDSGNFRPRVALGLEPKWKGTLSGDPDAAGEDLRELLTDTVARHLRTDRPSAILLSGGIDSALLGALARVAGERPIAYVAGSDVDGADGDRGQAAMVADELGLDLRQVTLDRGRFIDGWREMVHTGGMPLSTPNEVAIYSLAKAMAADGRVVALGGEGADELFGGYEAMMDAAQAFEEADVRGLGAGRFHMEACAWIAPANKSKVLRPDIWEALEEDRALHETYDRLFEMGRRELSEGADSLEAHLRFLRLVNLTGLLERLDRSTMLASVEGRVPFADSQVRAFADALPMAAKYVPQRVLAGGEPGAVEADGAPRTKLVVRAAGRALVPARTLRRPKTSFPLPMADWIGGCGERLLDSPFAQALFQKEALELVAAAPSENWNMAWPMLNVAEWGDRWF